MLKDNLIKVFLLIAIHFYVVVPLVISTEYPEVEGFLYFILSFCLPPIFAAINIWGMLKIESRSISKTKVGNK